MNAALKAFEEAIEAVNRRHQRRVAAIMFWYRVRLVMIWALALSPLWVHFVAWAWRGFQVVGR